MSNALIERYASQAGAMKRWIAGLSRAECLAHPVSGTWSVQNLVVHMLDSDLVATHRMRRIAAEECPLLIAYDETLFARNINEDGTDLAVVADLFDLNRRFTAGFLRTLAPEALQRAGVHNQRGKVTLHQIIEIYVHHVDHHEPFLLAKRAAMGKPMR